MPPKKKLFPDSNQKFIFSAFGQSLPSNDQPTSDTSEPKKIKRVFLSKWLTDFKWLEYDKSSDFMYCTACTKSGKQNGMIKKNRNTNFQHSTLIRHAALNDHQSAIQAPVLQTEMKLCQDKSHLKEDNAMTVLLKAVKWMCTEDIPLVKYRSLVDLMQDVSVPDIQCFKNAKINYNSQYTVNELLDSLSSAVECDLNETLKESPFITLLADESTDISNKKRLVIYAQVIVDMVPETYYVCNVECKDATGKGIAQAILNEILPRGVSREKIMSFGSDGASVMTGKINGKFSTHYYLTNRQICNCL